MGLEKYREEFPMLNHWIFLDAAAHMIPGKYWLKAVRERLDLRECGDTEYTIHDATLTPLFSDFKKQASTLIGAREKEVTTMARVMSATNLIVNELIDWGEGDNVVFTDLCYPSVVFTLLGLRKKGVKLKRVEHTNGEILIHDLEEAIDDDTKLVVINRTTPFSGFTYNNVEEVCRIAHEHNAIVYDDAMQAVGAVNIDVHRDDVDILTTGSFKWQCGPDGAGIFYIKEDLIEGIEPKFRNYFQGEFKGIPFAAPNHDNIRDWDVPLVKTADRFNLGELASTVLFGWNATLEFLNRVGTDKIEKRNRELGSYLIEKLQEIGCKVLTPIEPEKRHGLIMYTTGSWDRDLKSYTKLGNPSFSEKPIKVSLRSQAGIEGIRTCTHFFNTEEDIDALINTQKGINEKEL